MISFLFLLLPRKYLLYFLPFSLIVGVVTRDNDTLFNLFYLFVNFFLATFPENCCAPFYYFSKTFIVHVHLLIAVILLLLSQRLELSFNNKYLFISVMLVSISIFFLKKSFLWVDEVFLHPELNKSLVCIEGKLLKVSTKRIGGEIWYKYLLCGKNCIVFYSQERCLTEYLKVCGYLIMRENKCYLKSVEIMNEVC